ncbi:hypothetical protein GQ464_002060 [Rhodocaloribacter litoris]|uniref:hypothetical protein n=1 Tax=Rhodocaloribacter litoris TaxID=2558931 RepID=UPI001421F260|nr:hypothetical protein [Rhodocaloribacter litoris]QXD15754.1 hypothetical protein GQ464_002060 [Rhodocaloribacter litoris]GIV60254.1 MAG: hypothetical protein KatS3mg043_1343 [Rhodothermaceae bacterium]
MRRWVLAALPIFFASSLALGQSREQGEVWAEINFAAGVPQGAFDERLERDAYGLLGFLGGRVPGSPLVLGSEVGFLHYGTGSRLSLHRSPLDDGLTGDFALPLEALNVAVTNNVLMGHLVLRLQPSRGVFLPYVDVVGGLRYFVTHIDVESDVVIFRRGLDQDARVTDLALSYGAGGGFELVVHTWEDAWEGTARASVHAGLRYLFGTEAEYAASAAFEEIDGRILLDLARSRTDMLVPVFGFRVRR